MVSSLETVTIYTNHRVDAKRLKELDKEYDAVLLAFGTRLSKKVRAKNEREDIKGYWGAISMLDKVNLWNKYRIGSPASNELKRIKVVGSGWRVGFTLKWM